MHARPPGNQVTAAAKRIPAFLNTEARGAAAARDALSADARFDLREVAADGIVPAIRAAETSGTPRVLISGGDGTLAAAVGAAASTRLEIALLPAGTLNHFARDAGIPADPGEALDLAAEETARGTDVAWVNGRVVLNTSSVGTYVDFVRRRQALERPLGYHVASIIAAFRVWLSPRHVDVELEVDGTSRGFRTPLLFVGVGERVLTGAGLGARRPDGARALHVLVVNERRRGRLAAIAFSALVRGSSDFLRTDEVDEHLVARAVVRMRRRRRTIAVDGELASMDTPLEYELKRDAVLLVRPAAGAGSGVDGA